MKRGKHRVVELPRGATEEDLKSPFSQKDTFHELLYALPAPTNLKLIMR